MGIAYIYCNYKDPHGTAASRFPSKKEYTERNPLTSRQSAYHSGQDTRRNNEENFESRSRRRRTCCWISFSQRPLTVTELHYAHAITLETTEIDDHDLIDEESITSVCAGLVTIDKESSVIRLVHYTT